MKWTDIQDIAIELSEAYPDIEPITIRFTQLMKMILSLPEFEDQANHCNEKILEAIQAAWIEEKE